MSRRPSAADYAVLGLRPGAGDAEIRAAFRRLAKLHHPDRNPGDPVAARTFQRISESYALLRERVVTAPASPLAAAREERRQASRRRGTAAAEPCVADLAVGGSLWIAADALLVAPDRTVALRPGAVGAAFPTAERVIRVEQRAEGLHVFMPPQPSARWELDDEAETAGLAIAALWVGERQDGPSGSARAARLPRRLVGRSVAELAPGERGWAAAGALERHPDGSWSLDPEEPVSRQPHRATPLRIVRDDEGLRVHSELPAASFVVTERVADRARSAVLTALLADAVPPRPAPPT